MAEILHSTNFDPLNIVEIAELSADALLSQKIIIPNDSQGIVADDFVVVGFLGAETSEIGQVDVVAGNSITLTANLIFKHYRNETITKLFGEQIKIYRATNVDGTVPADSAFASIGTVNIEADQMYSTFNDTTGGAGFWYKKTYYNSFLANETDLEDATAVRGGGVGHYVSVDEVRREAGFTNNRWITDDVIYEKLLSAEGEVNAILISTGYTLPLTDTPEQIKNATRLLAAGYLLTMDYGPEFNGTAKDGEKKIKMARDILTQIQSGAILLINNSGVSISQSSKTHFYPTDSEETTEPRKFSLQDTW